jgi:hypothetical protein
LEEATLLGGASAAPVSQLVGRRAGLALRPGGGVGFGLGSGYIVARPVAGMPGTRGVTFGARFQRADACFDRAIIPWRMGRREQQIHADNLVGLWLFGSGSWKPRCVPLTPLREKSGTGLALATQAIAG